MRACCSIIAIATLLSCAVAPSLHAQSGSTSAWQLSTTPGGRQVASIRSNGPLRGLSLACQASAPMLVLAISLPGAMTRANLSLSGAGNAAAIRVPIVRNPRTGAWWTLLPDRAALDLLSGASDRVSMAINGVALGTIPLAGSSNAIRTALATCYASAAVPVAAIGGASGTSSANSLPLRFGTYVRAGKRCGSFADQVFIDAGNGGAGDAPYEGSFIESVRKTGANTYAAREKRNDEAGTPFTATYTMVDREHFTVRSEGRSSTFAYCPLESLPRDQQKWAVSEYKDVQSLPVKPGYYLGRTEGDAKCEYCSYYLFRNDGIAVVNAGFSGSGSRRVLRRPRITQTGALDYWARTSGKDEVEHIFTIISPTHVVEEDGESSIVIRPIDPAKIAARHMPRL